MQSLVTEPDARIRGFKLPANPFLEVHLDLTGVCIGTQRQLMRHQGFLGEIK